MPITEDLVTQFVRATGDENPVHLSNEFATAMGLSGPVVHGFAYASFLSRLVGMHLPGPGSMYAGQTIQWAVPVRIGDVVRFVGEVTHLARVQRAMFIKTEAFNQHGQRVLSGTATVTLLGDQPAESTSVAEVWPTPQVPRNELEPKRVVLVTGATGGVGRAICQALTSKGYDIAVHFRRDQQSAERFCQTLMEAYPEMRALPFQADLSEEEAGSRLVESVSEVMEPPAIIVANASAQPVRMEPLRSDWKEQMERHLEVAVRGHFEVIRAVVPSMRKSRFGRIIGILSNAIIGQPVTQMMPYSVSKSALSEMLRVLAAELGPYGITVNRVLPGMMRTQMSEQISEREKELQIRRTPTRQLVRVEDVAAMVAFLVSPEAAQVNGCAIPVDGGERIQ